MSETNINPFVLKNEQSIYLPYPCYFVTNVYEAIYGHLQKLIEKNFTITKTFCNCPVVYDLKINHPEDPTVVVYVRTIFIGPFNKNGHYFCVYTYKNNDNVKKIKEYLSSFKEELTSGVFEYNPEFRTYDKTAKQINITSEMIGVDDIISQIEKDIHCLNKYADRMKKMGMNLGKNYLLTGPPGTGKTSLVREIAHRFNYPLLLGNIESHEDICAELYNPGYLQGQCESLQIDEDNIIIAVFEDCDRYISEDQNTMACLLNSLEGIIANKKILRFFTVNDCSKFVGCDAFMNRISRKFVFTLPGENLLKQYLIKHFDNNQMDLINKFSNVAAGKNVSYRLFVNYISRYIDAESDEEVLKLCIDNIEKYASEINAFESNSKTISFETNSNSTYSSDNHFAFPIDKCAAFPIDKCAAFPIDNRRPSWNNFSAE